MLTFWDLDKQSCVPAGLRDQSPSRLSLSLYIYSVFCLTITGESMFFAEAAVICCGCNLLLLLFFFAVLFHS